MASKLHLVAPESSLSYPVADNEAAIVVNAPYGPTLATRQELERARDAGIERVLIQLEGVGLIQDDELIALIMMELEEIAGGYGYSGDRFRLVQCAASCEEQGSGDAQNSAAAPVSACDLISQEEVEQIVGRQFRFGDAELVPVGRGSACDFGGGEAQILVFSGHESVAYYEGFLKAFGRELEERIPLPELSEGAFLMLPQPRNQYEDTLAIVGVTVGNHSLQVSVAAERSNPATSVQSAAIALTKAVLSRLR